MLLNASVTTPEKIAKHLVERQAQKISQKEADLILKFSEESVNILMLAMESFFSRDVNKANEVIDSADLLSEKIKKSAYSLQNNFNAEIMSILDSIGRVAMYSADIAELAINDAMRSAGETATN